MSFIIFMVLFSSLAYSVEQGKKEWRHNQARHVQNIEQNNPDWHPRKVRRHARRRAATWWTLEAVKGFPSMRRAWREDRDHVRYLRETSRISQETRIDELRAELDAIRRGREEHEAARTAGDTRLPFGPWYEKHSARLREEAPVPASTAPAVDSPPPIKEAQPTAPAPADSLAQENREDKPESTPSAAETSGPPITQELEALIDSNGAAPQAGQPSGELTGDSPYRAAFTALEQYDMAAQQHCQAAEVLEAQLTMHGFDRDPQLMTHVRGMQESAGQISSEVAGARQTLTANHAQGAEYHQSGVSADSSAFRNDS